MTRTHDPALPAPSFLYAFTDWGVPLDCCKDAAKDVPYPWAYSDFRKSLPNGEECLHHYHVRGKG